MATKKMKPRGGNRYPWDDWFKGPHPKTLRLRRDKDFFGEPFHFGNQARLCAKDRGYKVSVSVEGPVAVLVVTRGKR